MSAHKPHVIPLSVYLGVGTALLFLTAITVWVAGYHLGVFNLLVAMLIASVKAALVGLIFMHLFFDNKFYMMIFLSAVMFLGVFISLTMLDTMRRDDIDPTTARPIKPQAVIYENLPPAPSAEQVETEH